MDLNVDLVYSQYIKPLSYNERLIIAQKILQDFMQERTQEGTETADKLKMLRKFKGIAKSGNTVIKEEDWYKQ